MTENVRRTAISSSENGKIVQGSARQWRAFEKAVLVALGPAIKGTGWRKSGAVLFRQAGDFFHEVRITVSLYDGKTHVTHCVKPMALDPILWDILGMPGNAGEPLSFRTNGAFTCPGLPMYEEVLEQSCLTPGDAASSLMAVVVTQQALLTEVLQASDFSSLVAQHTNQLERGAYAVTLVTSLINDGDCDAAARLASAYASGERESCCDISVEGVSVHRLALDWLAAGAASTKFATWPCLPVTTEPAP